MTAKIVVFEGPDKVGKETQSKLLWGSLLGVGKNVVRVEVPSDRCDRSYRLIYWMLRTGWAKKLPNVFQFVQFLNKWLFQRLYLMDLLYFNDYVIFDRWSLSAVVYGNATGVNKPFNDWLYKQLRKADITFVMCERSFRRASTQDDSYEKDSALQSAVRVGYREWAETHPSDHVLVNNDQSIKEVHADVLFALDEDEALDAVELEILQEEELMNDGLEGE